VKNYEFTDDLPKGKMFVKLNPNITTERREFISNGIRSYFRDDTTILLDLKSSSGDITQALTFFQIFVGIIGAIALSLAFFLLLISTTQNIRENIWEYGCLRAMGLSKGEGLRLYLYE